jgi:hypothetical protein
MEEVFCAARVGGTRNSRTNLQCAAQHWLEMCRDDLFLHKTLLRRPLSHDDQRDATFLRGNSECLDCPTVPVCSSLMVTLTGKMSDFGPPKT